MNSKKYLITIVVVIVVLVAGWYLWKGNGTTSTLPTQETTSTTEQSGVEGQISGQETTGQIGTIGKMTDDIYIEMLVQAAYQAQKNPASYALTMKNLYDKYGITAENVTAYGESLQKDPARAQTIMQKYSQELQKLMK